MTGYFHIAPAFTIGGAGRKTVPEADVLECIKHAIALSPIGEVLVIEVPTIDTVPELTDRTVSFGRPWMPQSLSVRLRSNLRRSELPKDAIK